jgi:small-conductance mechanosensitive channel
MFSSPNLRRLVTRATVTLIAVPALLSAASPPASGSSPWLLTSVGHDAGSAVSLAQQQIAEPVRPGSALIVSLALLVLGIVMIWPLRLWLLSWVTRLVHRFDHHGHYHAHAKAVSTVVATVLLIGFGVHLIREALDTGFVLLPSTAALADTAAAGLVVTGLGLGIGRALRSPDDPGRRPLPLPEELGHAAGFYPLAGGIMLGLAGFIERTSTILHASAVSWTIAHALLILIETALAAGFLVTIGRIRDAEGAETAGPRRSTSFTLTGLAWAAIIIGLIAFLLGYTRFAVLLFQELIWSSLVIVTALLLVRLVDALIGWLLGTEHAAGRFATHIVGLRSERIGQLSILATGLASVVIWGLAIGLIAAPLGGAGVSLVDQVQPGLLLGELRTLHFAPQAVATAVSVLVVGLALTRILRRWLERRFLPATALDVGVRTSIVMGLSYAGVVLALLAATNALGIDLDKITLIASALSVGIGFGLQSIIQNFVSGVILLVERPIKIGDWVSTSGAEGSVRRINVRATELAMADGSIAIVPNSSFISASVQNRTGAGVAGRLEMTIKISGTGSPVEARDGVLALIEKNEDILKDPAPRLLFTDASEGAYGFTLHAYGPPGRQIADIHSDLLFALVQGLGTAGLKATIS